MKNIITILWVSGLFALSGCSHLRTEDCTYDFGFSRGVNDAQANIPMNIRLDSEKVCFESARRELVRGYREGYSIELRTRPAQALLQRGEQSNSRDLTIPECRVAYGDRVCGYGCIVMYGQIRCASKPGSGCLAAFGDIRCGKNCEVNQSRIDCVTYE